MGIMSIEITDVLTSLFVSDLTTQLLRRDIKLTGHGLLKYLAFGPDITGIFQGRSQPFKLDLAVLHWEIQCHTCLQPMPCLWVR